MKKKNLTRFVAIVVTMFGCLTILPFSALAAQNSNADTTDTTIGYYGNNNKGKNAFGMIGCYDTSSSQTKTEGCYYTGHHRDGATNYGVTGTYTE